MKFKRRLAEADQPDLFQIADNGEADTPEPQLRPSHEQLRFISFGSGSSGNCAYIGTESCGLLIDAGVDNNRVVTELAANAISPQNIAGIVITHDHSDHVRFAYSLLRRYRHMKLYATPKTMNGLLRRHSISRRIQDYHQPIFKEFPFRVGDLSVTAFETSHDGTDNCGYCIEGGGTSFVVATDTGIVTPRADHYIRTAEHWMIEADYDAAMLRNGPYPERLKARIASCEGHLDNAVTAAYLAGIVPAYRLRTVFLCHLSHINNTPQLAFHCVRTALEEAGARVTDIAASALDPRLRLAVLPRLESSPLTVLAPAPDANHGIDSI